MTELLLRLRQPLADGYLDTGAVAEVSQLLDENGGVVSQPWRKTQTVGVYGGGPDSDRDTFARFDLPAGGRYSINIRLPRGSDIEREVSVSGGETHSEEIDLPVSPHEYLGWQQFSGAVRNEPYEPRPIEPMLVSRSPEQRASLEALARIRHRERDLFERRGELPNAHRLRMLPGLNVPNPYYEPTAWANLEGVQLSPPIFDWEGVQVDDRYALWTPFLPDDPDSYALLDGLRGQPLPAEVLYRFPRWMLFDRQGRRDLASVPWGWWGMVPRQRGEGMQFLYDRASSNPIDPDQPGRLVVSVQDTRWGGLLAFVASGRLFEAAELAVDVFKREPPEEALYGKLKGPLVAALGGIILVATASDNKEQYWDQWLSNLANWFPEMPDGAILHGYRLLQLGRHKEGHERLMQAMDAGVPYFAAAFGLLSLGLSQLEDDDAFRRVSPIASRVDPSQPFTVIRLPGG